MATLSSNQDPVSGVQKQNRYSFHLNFAICYGSTYDITVECTRLFECIDLQRAQLQVVMQKKKEKLSCSTNSAGSASPLQDTVLPGTENARLVETSVAGIGRDHSASFDN